MRQAVLSGEVRQLMTQAIAERRQVAPAADLPRTREYLDWIRSHVLEEGVAPGVDAHAAVYRAAREEVNGQRLVLLDELRGRLSASRDQARRVRDWTVVGLGVTLTVAAFLVYSFFLVISGGLRQLNLQMERMAGGDLSARLQPRGKDEVADTMRAMTEALVRLSDLLAAVRQGAAGVYQAAQVVATGNAELSRRNGEESRSLDGVVAGIEAYTRQLQDCGREVERVVGAVQSLRLDAARNRKQMQRLQERMAQLRAGSHEIGDIVRLIDSVAFRTNILALNASVEASKAGEAGRGFAIVAQEVRSLAQRSAESARRIGDIVQRSAEDVETSGALVEETSRTQSAADEQVDLIHQTMEHVSSMTVRGEQDAAELLAALRGLRGGAADTRRLVNDLASASAQLRSQGDRLANKIGQFNLS